MRTQVTTRPRTPTEPWRLAATAAAVVLVADALRILPTRDAADPAWRPLFQWVAANILFWTALGLGAPRPRARSFRPNWLAALALITLGGLALRLWRLADLPATLDGDEANFGLETLRVLRGELRNPFVFAWFSHPSPVFLFQSLGWRITDHPVLAVRLPSALVGALSVALAGLAAARTSGRGVGLLTAALLAVWHFHIHYSRMALSNIGDALIGSLFVLLLQTAWTRRAGPFHWALAGGVAALGLYGYHGGRLFGPLLFVILFGWFLVDKGALLKRKGWGMVVPGFLLVAAPMLQRAWLSPDDFMARHRLVGLFSAGILRDQGGVGAAASLFLDQTRRGLLAFHVFPDQAGQYGWEGPLLDPLFGTILIVGFLCAAWAVVVQRRGRPWPWVVWWCCGLAGAALAHPAPSSPRLAGLGVPACFFMALALSRLAGLAQKGWPRVKRGALMAAAALLFAALSLTAYWREYLPQRIGGGPRALLSTELAPRLRALPDGWGAVFFGAPAMRADFPTLRYLLPDLPVLNVEEPLSRPVSRDDFGASRGRVFIFTPHRLNELRYVNATWPDGRAESLLHPVSGEVMAVLYWVGPGEASTP